MKKELKTSLENIARLRAQLRSKGRFNLEFKAVLSSLLRSYNIDVDDVTLAKLTIALPEEISTSLTEGLPKPEAPSV